MRIALVIEQFGPLGGVENVAWNVARSLAKSGEEVHVVARELAPCPEVTPHALGGPRGWQPLRVLAFSHAAAREAVRGDYDVVHSFSRTLHQDIYRAGGGSHSDFLERSHPGARGFLRRFTPRHATLLQIERRIFRDAHQIIQCNSTMVRNEIQRRHGVSAERLVVIENGVDLERFHPGRREHEGIRMRQSLRCADRTVWLFAGSGFQRKGLDTALRALAIAEPTDLELWVAGSDPPAIWSRLARQLGVADRVRFLGSRSDLEAVYAGADGLLLPTRYDAFANVCLEAAAAGLPVVTSTANGAAEFVQKHGGEVVPADDPGGVAHALEMLSGADARRERGVRLRRGAEARGWDRHVDDLRELYRRSPS